MRIYNLLLLSQASLSMTKTNRNLSRTLHPDNMAAGPASYGMTDTMGRMHSDAQFAGSSSVPAHVEMMGLIGMGNNPMVGATVAVAAYQGRIRLLQSQVHQAGRGHPRERPRSQGKAHGGFGKPE